MQAYAHASFLCLCHGLFSKSLLGQKAAARHPIKIATIRLQWNPKPKMMPPAKVVLPNKPGEIRSKRRLPAKSKQELLKMFDTLKRDALLCALAAALVLAVAPPSSAQPTEAQKEAVKPACRSDYMAHCSSVTPGGEAALQCL